MLSKIKGFLNLDESSRDFLNVGSVPYNKSLENFNELNIVYRGSDEEIPKMDICFIDNTVSKELMEKIRKETDILVSLGSCTSFNVDLIIPGVSITDDFLKIVVESFIDDNLEYFKPLFAMTRENDFRTKTILVTVSNDLCTGCSACAFICPQEAIEMKNTRPKLESALCVHCGCCFMICPKSWILNEEVEAWC